MGGKRKKSKLITIQQTANGRRIRKYPDKMGRRRKDLGKRKQLNIGEEGESVWYALPK